MPSKKKNKSRRQKSKTRMKTKTRNKVRSRKKVGKKKAARKKRPTRISTRKRSAANIESRLPTAAVPPSSESDFQGLSRTEEADSESVDELVEEGNVFEAGAVAGVEEADNADEKEVHTHEVSEDDVPDEYLEKD
jgi:hypothetical protein